MLQLSVILCTYNRAHYLEKVFASLIHQTLPKSCFEIVLIDDGSADHTLEVVHRFQDALPIKYFFQSNSGLAAAKNAGIVRAEGEILFFFDDDDSAAPTLLERHVKLHHSYAEENYAVLNYTTWAPSLKITSLMRFLTDVGCYLFGYPRIFDKDILDYTYFWGGRSSCKRSFLDKYGSFNPRFRFGCEDIELGYRLSKHGLKVVYDAKAISYMERPLKLDDFLNRLLKQGRSQYHFSTMYKEEGEVRKWCEVDCFEETWANTEAFYESAVKSARWLEKISDTRLELGIEPDRQTERLFYQALWNVFTATKIKGMCEAKYCGY